MKKQSISMQEVEYCHVCLPFPFARCINVVVAVPTPLIISVFGQSGEGKSLFASSLANAYARRGYTVVPIITERTRIHSALPYSDECNAVLVKQLDTIPDIIEDRMGKAFKAKNFKGVLLILDSMAVVTDTTGRFAARWTAQKTILDSIVISAQRDKRKEYPTIALLLDQYRQGNPVPGTLITAWRGTIPASLHHCIHAIFRLRSLQDGQRVEIKATHLVMQPVAQTESGIDIIPSRIAIKLQEFAFSLDEMQAGQDWLTFNRRYRVMSPGGIYDILGSTQSVSQAEQEGATA